MKKVIFVIIITLILLVAGYFVYQQYFIPEESDFSNSQPSDLSNMVVCTEEAKLCSDGSAVGRVGPNCEFAECPIFIRVDYPKSGQEIESPLIIEGEARGIWFFEGDFPVILTNWDGLIIAEGYATAQSDWMTEEFVRFKGEIKFEKPELYNTGSLILQKDNPSGLPMNDDALDIPIIFK